MSKEEDSRKKKKGIVSAIIGNKDFGFICSEGENADMDLFFHRSAVTVGEFDDLQPGDNVEYIKVPSEKGWRAVGVKKLEG